MDITKIKALSDPNNLNIIGGDAISKILMQFSKLGKLNKIYSANVEKNGIEFIDSIIETLGLNFEVNPDELKRIPQKGAFITVSNHPFGGIDGLLLLKIISQIRPDFKIMANYILQNIHPIKNEIIPINASSKREDASLHISGIKSALGHLRNGKPLGIFPSGKISVYHFDNKKIADPMWQFSLLRFIKKAEVPVIPIYFIGNNSILFHLLGKIHPILRTAKLPSEFLNKKNKIIKIRIGNPISVKEQKEFENISQYGRFLRAKTYMLGTAIKVNKFFRQPLIKRRNVKIEEIAPPIPQEKILKDIEYLKKEYLLFTSRDFSVFCAPSVEIPNLLPEIGRLREITFREVGEGTNQAIDLDEFDLYYEQLVIWDNENKKVVGAYRVGKGKEIIDQYGIKGLYINTLFKIKKGFTPVLEKSLELGRSFIVKEYQRKPLSLFLLWKGILYFLLKNPEYQYLIGPVSISNQYSRFSKGLIVEFVKENYYNEDFAKYIKPRKRFKLRQNRNIDREILIKSTKSDLKKLDKYIRDVQANLAVPVLLKKYIGLNAKIIGFNIDPKFNKCLDGLIILDLYDVPINTIEALSKELNDDTILARFNQPEP